MFDKLTRISQKLRREILLVGVVDSGVLVPISGLTPAEWIKVIGEGLLLKIREPLLCLGLSFFSNKDVPCPENRFHNNTKSNKSLWTFAITRNQ